MIKFTKIFAQVFQAMQKKMQYTLYITLFIFVVSLSFLVSSVYQNIGAEKELSPLLHETVSLENNNNTQSSFIPNEIADDTVYSAHKSSRDNLLNDQSVENHLKLGNSLARQQLQQLFDAHNLNSNLIPELLSQTSHELSGKKSSQFNMFTFNAAYSNNPMDTLTNLIVEMYDSTSLSLQLLSIAQEVNIALSQTLQLFEIPQEDMHFIESAIRVNTHFEPYPYLVTELSTQERSSYFSDEKRMQFIKFLQNKFNDLSMSIAHGENKNIQVYLVDEQDFLYIMFENVISHIIRLSPRKERVPKINTLQKDVSYCTIIIDDIGEDFVLARKFMDLPFSVVFSIWPQSTHATSLATLAYEKGLPIFLHQPMQAIRRDNYEPDIGLSGLTIDMTQEEMKRILQHNILSVPHLRGINNHMGSLFTSTPVAVENFLKATKSLMPQVFILDSYTHANSVLLARAREYNFLSAQRHYFIDNKDQDVVQELKKVYAHAKAHKHVYAIGHARPQTLRALQNWEAQFDKTLIFTLPSY